MRLRFTKALRSRVAIRMATMFFLCAGLPLGVLATLNVTQTSSMLEERARARLQYEARSVAQEGLGKLDALARALDLFARSGAAFPTDTGRLESLAAGLFPKVPAALTLVAGRGSVVPVTGVLDPPALTIDQERHLDDWGRLIVADGRNEHRLLLIVASSGGTGPRAVTEIDPRALFELDDDEARPPQSEACISVGTGPVACSGAAQQATAGDALKRTDLLEMTVDGPEGSQFVRKFVMPLAGQYAAPEWTLLLMRPAAVIQAPIANFLNNVWLTAFLAMLIAGWLGIAQVRRQMQPLETLTEATTRLARRGFDEPIVIDSNDEFQVLGDAFNQMSAQLKRQFSELEAFNLGTLSALARAIDAKSPWTAGHSERVTAGAVALAVELGLTAEETDELRRGGLVHDIGKLATPAEILDKPGRLTPDEEHVMRLHPEQGVHILEPIPAFGPLLPIVGQHHEQWDGSGYPKGLAREAISRPARVLAVADVYDALRSERPYRSGLPFDEVVEIIAAGAGTHFDPRVVEAFLSLAPQFDRLTERSTQTTGRPNGRHSPNDASLLVSEAC